MKYPHWTYARWSLNSFQTRLFKTCTIIFRMRIWLVTSCRWLSQRSVTIMPFLKLRKYSTNLKICSHAKQILLYLESSFGLKILFIRSCIEDMEKVVSCMMLTSNKDRRSKKKSWSAFVRIVIKPTGSDSKRSNMTHDLMICSDRSRKMKWDWSR